MKDQTKTSIEKKKPEAGIIAAQAIYDSNGNSPYPTGVNAYKANWKKY